MGLPLALDSFYLNLKTILLDRCAFFHFTSEKVRVGDLSILSKFAQLLSAGALESPCSSPLVWDGYLWMQLGRYLGNLTLKSYRSVFEQGDSRIKGIRL